jgi:hypothetical protein
VKYENGDVLVDSHKILNTYVEELFLSIVNVHRVSDVRRIEIHKTEPFVPQPSPFNVEIAIANL